MEILTKYIMYIPKNKKYLLYVLSIVMCSIVNARTITEGEAIQKALEFLHVEDRSAEIERFFISGKAEMYKVTTTNGWILLSSET